jgi:hypothetical protein
VLLHGKEPVIVRTLAARFAALDDRGLELHSFPGIEPIGGCCVTVRLSR